MAKLPLSKIYHKASHVNQCGGVSALCYALPRAIDLRRASWTIRDEAVTCPRCKELMRQIANVAANSYVQRNGSCEGCPYPDSCSWFRECKFRRTDRKEPAK